MEGVTSPRLVFAEDLGVSAHVRQFQRLEWTRMIIDLPTVILVIHGTKKLRWPGGDVTLSSGEVVALGPEFRASILGAQEAPEYRARLPLGVVQNRHLEPLIWLKSLEIRFRLEASLTLTDRIRKLLTSSVDRPWSTGDFAQELAMSEACTSASK